MSTTEAPSAPPAAVVSNEAVVKSEPPAPQSGDNAAAESKNDATETVKEEIPVQSTDSVPKPDSAPADPKPEISVADSKQAGEAAEKSQEERNKQLFETKLPEFLEKITSDLTIPKASVKRCLRVDKAVTKVQSDAVYLLAKSAECFVTELAHLTAKQVEKQVGGPPRRVIQYEHVRNSYIAAKEDDKNKDWAFLDEVLPPKRKKPKV